MNEQDKITTNEKLGRVYLITSPSVRKYVGSTEREVEERWKSYKNYTCKNQTKLHRSLVKYGWDAHTKELIWEGPLELMLRMEHLLGLEHNVLCPKKGLNCTLPGYDDVPGLVSEETRKKMSDSAKTKIFSEEHRNKMSESRKGKIRSKETVDKIAQANRGKTRSDEFKKKMSDIGKIKNFSDETRRKISEANKGKPGNKGYQHSEEAKAKISKTNKGRKCKPFSEEHKRKMSAKAKGKIISEETKLKKSKPFMCNETGEIFKNLIEGSKLGIAQSTLSYLLNNGNVSTKTGYSFKYIDKQ